MSQYCEKCQASGIPYANPKTCSHASSREAEKCWKLYDLIRAANDLSLSAIGSMDQTETATTANEIVGCVVDVPTKLREAADLVSAAITLNRVSK